MPELDLAIAAADGRDLLAAAETDWLRPVPHCPGWDAARLVGHMGAILDWIARIVATGEPVARKDRETPPAGHAALAPWYSAHLSGTLDILTTTAADSPAWTFSSCGERRAGWWRRRLAVELAIHRWDAQHAASLGGSAPPRPVDAEVAAAGIQEYLTEFLPGLLAQPQVSGVTGTLHLHATDGPSEWWVDLDARADAAAVPGHAKADTAVRGTESDLLLWLTNRGSGPSVAVLGNGDVAASWTQLRR
ncbi:MAG: maleylpyruvate isomerase N-terminal domain-containing protein [Streptosporangiaceae bacterium]